MKIGIISDAHLFHKYAITPAMYKSVLIDGFADVDIIVDCGDLTDKANLTADQLDEMSKVFDDVKKPMYIVAGNHDSLNNTTVASILGLNDNIHIIKNEPQLIDNMLFVPYTDNMRALYKKLDKLVDEQVDVMFSHLNITGNLYASLSFKDIDKILKYSRHIFNGHIHTPEAKIDVFGAFCNVGSSSSLTFNDEHYPCFCIYNTETREIETFTIKNIIHRTYDITKQNISDILNGITNLTKTYKIRCRINIPNNVESVEIRKQLREKLELNDNVVSIVFNYTKDKEAAKKIRISESKVDKTPLMEQLFNYFEIDCGVKLDDEIKKELL